MPVKERYWKDPEKWRKASRERARYLAVIIGNWHDCAYTPQAQENRKAYKRKYGTTHRKQRAAAARRYRRRITKLFGTSGLSGVWRYKMMREEQRAAKRKHDLALLSRKLVEDRRRANLVSGRQRPRA